MGRGDDLGHCLGACILLAWAVLVPGASDALELARAWPEPATLDARVGTPVRFASHSPFTLADVGRGPEHDPPTEARGTLFLPDTATSAQPVPAVVLLHGASGVQATRGPTYGRQLAAMGVAALVIDVFGARAERARGFIARLLEITEAMFLADAYSGLGYLAARPDIDGARIALIGFSYGGMATLYAVQAQVAESFAPSGLRFAAHAAFYAPCIARFADARTTGAPVLMLFGGRDAIVDRARCAQTAAWLVSGGSPTETVIYEDAVHQWDGRFAGPRKIGRSLAPCRLSVSASGHVRDERTFLPMASPFWRKVILGLCADDEGYLIGRDDAVRARANLDLGRFLERVIGHP